jgi:hypothetical protein
MITPSLILLLTTSLVQASTNQAALRAPDTARPTRWGPSVSVKKRARSDSSDIQENAKKPKPLANPDTSKEAKKLVDKDGDTAMSEAQPASSAAAAPAVVTHPENEVKQKATNAMSSAASTQNVPMTDVDQKEAAQHKRCNNLLILLDPEAAELTSGSASLVDIMAQNFFHRFAPMLVSGSLVQNYLCWLEVARKKVAELKSAGQDPKPWLAANNGGPLLVAQALPDDPTTQSSWFVHKHASLVLCIPHKYLAEQYPMCANVSEQIEKAGFNVGPESEWIELTTQTFFKHIMNSDATAPLVKPIISCLSKDPDAQWNILLCGHGDNALLPSRITHYEKTLTELETVRDQLTSDEKNKGKLAYLNLAIKKMKRQFDIQKAHPQDIVADTTEIGGLCFAEFIDLLKHLNEHNVAHLHCKTCAVGGYNRVFIQETLKTINPKFLLTASGGCDGSIYEHKTIPNENHLTWRQDYPAFFKDFRKVFESLCRGQDNLNLLGRAIGNLYAPDINPPYGYIYLPQTEKFEPLSYGFADIECLHETDPQREQTFVVNAKLAFIVQSQNVQTPLHFQNYCPVFCIGKTIKKNANGEKLHLVADPTVTIKFKEIQTPLNFTEFMKSLLITCHYYPHRFLIDRLCYKIEGTETAITDLDFLYTDDTYTLSCRIPKPHDKHHIYQESGTINANYEMKVTGCQEKSSDQLDAK